ncbi:MAG: family acetyltransferase [Hyphomicrobiales bacterium]|nr:family acetyltransferase [Hyphomicrobiales bacterium]
MHQPQPARAVPARITLLGQYCRLEPIGAEHAADLHAATAGEGEAERYRWLFDTPPTDAAALSDWTHGAAASADPLHFAVVDNASGRAGGRQALMRITPEHGCIELGAVLWGRGVAKTRLATEAVYLTARHVFEDLGYRRFEWKCNALNEPSRRAAQRFGFQFEGIFRQHMIIKGESRDTAWFAMLDGDWPGLRAGYQRWLDPDNFDAGGAQKTRLAVA